MVAINYAYSRHPRVLAASDYGFFLVALPFVADQMASDETSCK